MLAARLPGAARTRVQDFLELDPVQRVSLVMGAWFIYNGVGAFILYPAFTNGTGVGDLNGYSPLALHVNGWHALLHLIPGLLGVVAARDLGRARRWTLGMAVLYAVAGVWGLITGDQAFGVVSVERFGSIVHLIEASIAALVLAVTSARGRPTLRRVLGAVGLAVLIALSATAVAAAASDDVVNMCCCGAC